jgi:radical SAM superfamily enzyme YgiQ (UPF0313 family)
MLSGYLKENGFEVLQQDYNMRYLDYWRKKIFNGQVPEGISTEESSVLVTELLNRLFLQKNERGYYYSFLFSPEPFGLNYNDRTNSSFSFVEKLLSSEYLFPYIEDKKENTFLQFFLEEDVLSYIEQHKINLVGISITAPSQVIGAFSLGYLIKKSLPDVHVALGGQWVSLYREELKKRPQWQRFFDSIIIFEGETPLYSLAASLCENSNLSRVPNLIYKSDSRWKQSQVNSKENLNGLACPDFEGLPLKKYSASEGKKGISLTYQTARECYWNRCIYCVDLPLPKQGYREREMDLVISDIKKLIKSYGLTYLEISNAVISPPQIRGLSERILQEGMQFDWWCFCRLESGFTKELFELAKRAGCQDIGFGLESGNQRMLDFINKGINLEVAKRVIMDCRSSGINVNLQVMLGLPSETIQEALDTIKFLIEFRDYISSVAFNIYYVTPACQVYLNPRLYEIDCKKYPATPFKFFHEFSHITGELSRDRAGEFMDLYYKLLDKKQNTNKDTNSSDDFAQEEDSSHYTLSLSVGEDSVCLEYDFNNQTKEGFISEKSQVPANV